MPKAIAAAALAALLSVAAPIAAPLTDAERQRLVSHLQMTSAWLADELGGLTAAQFHFRRGPDEWTIAEVLEHLVMVGDIYWRDLQTAMKQRPAARKSAMSDADVLWYGVDRSWKDRAIPGERPAGTLRDLETGLAAYRTRHNRLLEYVRTTREDLRGRIVERQGSDAYQWALLISTHEQRHVLQIREIKAARAFPKN